MEKRKKRLKIADCLYADSERNSDQLYLSHFWAPDPFLSLKIGRRKIGVLSDLEYGRARSESSFTEILSLTAVRRSASEWLGKKRVCVADQIAWLAHVYAIDRLRLPGDFPARLVEDFRLRGLTYEIERGPFFSSRQIKSAAEVEMIREGNRCSAAGHREVRRLLRSSTIKAEKLYYKNRPLTSERVRQAIEVACLKAGGISAMTIVAGGDQACDPHSRGTGPLRANELIVVDIFPRMSAHGYFGDMTRTYLKGRASDAQGRLVETVRSAQKLGFSQIRARINGRTIHRSITEFFTAEGFKTGTLNGVPQGFVHGTGHSLGLDIHEFPRISTANHRLRSGHVVTVEPGLYYHGLGGCRIEDVVLVTKTGYRMLSEAPYQWQFQ